MAKKKAAGGFNMAEEIRNLLRSNKEMSGKEVFEELTKAFPSQKINRASCNVAFYGARDALGIKSTRGGGKKRKKAGAKKIVMKRMPAAAAQPVDIAVLQAAAKFVSEVGDANTAVEAIRQLKSLQIQ